MTNSIERQLFPLSGPQFCDQDVNLKLLDNKKPQYSFKKKAVLFVKVLKKASFQAIN